MTCSVRSNSIPVQTPLLDLLAPLVPKGHARNDSYLHAFVRSGGRQLPDDTQDHLQLRVERYFRGVLAVT